MSKFRIHADKIYTVVDGRWKKLARILPDFEDKKNRRKVISESQWGRAKELVGEQK